MKILIGDCREVLKSLPDKSVHCCVTSPPYYGLRSYLPSDHTDKSKEIGTEKTPDEYINKLVEIFRDVKRVLRDDGTCWINISDCYANKGNKRTGDGEIRNKKTDKFHGGNSHLEQRRTVGEFPGLKPKDLIGIPWMLAFALRADGWYLRDDIIWEKGNAMCESVQDRCTRSYEHIFLFAKYRKYYFDNEAIKEPSVSNHPSGNGFKRSARVSYQNKDGSARGNDDQWEVAETRNKRSVWHVNTKPYKGAHFATFPNDLVEPCILAGSPVGGVVLDPFGGSGTVGQVCNQLGRDCVLIELNPEYKHLIEERINIKPTIKKQSKKRNEANHLSKVALQQNLLHYIN
jgi:site-specific DNA-methyltransferase (adenine-specific)